MKKPKQFTPKRSSSKKFTKPKPSAREKGYDKNWNKYRFRFLHHNKNCYCCEAPAKHVDHIRAVKDDKEQYFWKVDNYIPLCHSCHSYVTYHFDSCNPPKTQEKINWLHVQREGKNILTKVKVVPFKGENL